MPWIGNVPPRADVSAATARPVTEARPDASSVRRDNPIEVLTAVQAIGSRAADAAARSSFGSGK